MIGLVVGRGGSLSTLKEIPELTMLLHIKLWQIFCNIECMQTCDSQLLGTSTTLYKCYGSAIL